MNHRTILTLQEVSERTRVPLNTLRWMRHKGTGPPTWKLGRRVVAYEDDVEAWLDEQYRHTSDDRARAPAVKVSGKTPPRPNRPQTTTRTALSHPGVSTPTPRHHNEPERPRS